MPSAPLRPDPLKIWLLSAYHTGSHQAWARGYARHSRHAVQLLTLTGRFWKWRMQGGAVELARLAQAALATAGAPAAIITTDMVNLPDWLGLMRRTLPAHVPILHYMHENQLTYPGRPGEKPDFTYAMINWLSQMAADRVAFNSRYHAESWFAALPRLLKQFPDYNQLQQIDAVAKSSCVLPVGIDCARLVGQPAAVVREQAPLILWNQRWEYDKRPDQFFQLLYRVQAAGVPFRLAVAGQSFRNVPPAFDEAQQRLADQIVHWGYLGTVDDYTDLLRAADFVISTAEHEFFGISILEAIVAGAFPLLPNRLSYPELIPVEFHADCLYADADELFAKSVQRLCLPQTEMPTLRRHLCTQYDWPTVAAAYDHLIEEMV